MTTRFAQRPAGARRAGAVYEIGFGFAVEGAAVGGFGRGGAAVLVAGLAPPVVVPVAAGLAVWLACGLLVEPGAVLVLVLGVAAGAGAGS